MLRKLASFLFEEEEIIIEEEELHPKKESNYEIPKIEGIKAAPEKEEQFVALKKKETETETEIENKSVAEKEEAAPATEKPKNGHKIQRIDVDKPEKKKVEKPPRKTSVAQPLQSSVYQPQEIISPIFGGSEKKAEPIRLNKPKVQAKSSENSIISPMYGVVAEESSPEFDEEILDYDLKDMLSPKEGPAEVQVSLYDYLEDMSDDE